jgi:hypothetical protein
METPRSKRELFDSVRAHWPKEFRILEEQPVLPTVLTEPSDHEVYLAIEQRLGPNDEWHQLAAWAFHQALDILVRRRHSESGTLVRSEDVSFQSFDTQMQSNLAHSSWDAERPLYAGMPLK